MYICIVYDYFVTESTHIEEFLELFILLRMCNNLNNYESKIIIIKRIILKRFKYTLEYCMVRRLRCRCFHCTRSVFIIYVKDDSWE